MAFLPTCITAQSAASEWSTRVARILTIQDIDSDIAVIKIFGVRIYKPKHILAFWQEIHGALDSKWHQVFLKDPSIKQILQFDDEKIKVAIRRNQKLIEILEDLRIQAVKKEEFLDKWDPYRNSRDNTGGSKIERREEEGGRWGRRF
jgi:hypothetical protein